MSDAEIASNEFRRQHVVTKAVLRQWANPVTRKLEVYSKDSGNIDLRRPDEVCWVEWFIKDNPRRTETMWGDYERKLTQLYRALEDDSFFSNERATRSARQIIALHAARSHTTRNVSEVAKIRSKAMEARRISLENQQELVRRIKSRMVYPVPITQTMMIAEAERVVEANSADVEAGMAFFRERILVHFRVARGLMGAQAGLDVIVPKNPNTEFVVGDDPVLVPGKDCRFGALQGVGWFEAETMCMPFGPRRLIVASRSNRWLEVEDEFVDVINGHQLRQANTHLVTRPGSDKALWAKNVFDKAIGRTA